MFLLVFFLLHCIDIKIVVVLSNFALEKDRIDADPFSIVRGTEGQQLHLHENVLFVTVLIKNLELCLLSEIGSNR